MECQESQLRRNQPEENGILEKAVAAGRTWLQNSSCVFSEENHAYAQAKPVTSLEQHDAAYCLQITFTLPDNCVRLQSRDKIVDE